MAEDYHRLLGGEWTHDRDGVTVREVHIAKGYPNGDPRALPAGYPKRGDVHPDDANLRAAVITSRNTSRDAGTWNVEVEYRAATPEEFPELGLQRILIDSTILEEDTYNDVISGERISVTYTIPVGGAVVTHYPSAQTVRSIPTITLVNYETTTEAAIVARAANYVGTVNNAAINGWPLKTLRVDDIQCRPADRSDQRREVRTVLSYNTSTWRFLARYILYGRVPEDADEGNGFKRVDVRRATDFSALPITLPTLPP